MKTLKMLLAALAVTIYGSVTAVVFKSMLNPEKLTYVVILKPKLTTEYVIYMGYREDGNNSVPVKNSAKECLSNIAFLRKLCDSQISIHHLYHTEAIFRASLMMENHSVKFSWSEQAVQEFLLFLDHLNSRDLKQQDPVEGEDIHLQSKI